MSGGETNDETVAAADPADQVVALQVASDAQHRLAEQERRGANENRQGALRQAG